MRHQGWLQLTVPMIRSSLHRECYSRKSCNANNNNNDNRTSYNNSNRPYTKNNST